MRMRVGWSVSLLVVDVFWELGDNVGDLVVWS